MSEELCDPLTVRGIRFAAGDILDMLRVGQDDRELRFEDIPDWLPINTRGFHCHVRYL